MAAACPSSLTLHADTVAAVSARTYSSPVYARLRKQSPHLDPLHAHLLPPFPHAVATSSAYADRWTAWLAACLLAQQSVKHALRQELRSVETSRKQTRQLRFRRLLAAEPRLAHRKIFAAESANTATLPCVLA